jgi:hypothetical protein
MIEVEIPYEVGSTLYRIYRKAEKVFNACATCEGKGTLAAPIKKGYIECPDCKGTKGSESQAFSKFMVRKPTRIVEIDITVKDKEKKPSVQYTIEERKHYTAVSHTAKGREERKTSMPIAVYYMDRNPDKAVEPDNVGMYGFSKLEDAQRFADTCNKAEADRAIAMGELNEDQIAKELIKGLNKIPVEDFYGERGYGDYYGSEQMYLWYRYNGGIVTDLLHKITKGVWTHSKCAQEGKRMLNKAYGIDEEDYE